MNIAIGRQQLISWINDTLSLNVTRIEDLGVGSVYLQLMDFMNVTLNQNMSFPMNQVYWTTELLFDDHVVNAEKKRLKIIKNPQLAGKDHMMANYKLLQKWFQELKINKVIPIEKLILCKFQNNLEFAQWLFKHFLQRIKARGFNDSDMFLEYVRREELYDPVSRRFYGSSTNNSRRSSIITKRSHDSLNGTAQTSLSGKTILNQRTSSSISERRSPSLGRRDISAAKPAISATASRGPSFAQRASSAPKTVSQNVNFDIQESEQTKNLVTKYENIIETINSERQFYFNKLRSLELLILTIQENNSIAENPELQQLVTHVLKILYTNPGAENENSDDHVLNKNSDDHVLNENSEDHVLNDIGNTDEEVKKTSLEFLATPDKPLLSLDDSEMF